MTDSDGKEVALDPTLAFDRQDVELSARSAKAANRNPAPRAWCPRWLCSTKSTAPCDSEARAGLEGRRGGMGGTANDH
jgi:hypothetical protein